MNELREAIATIIELAGSMIDELDDETMLALADLLNLAAQRLQQMGNIPIPSQNPELNESMPSSNIESFGYDDKNGRLLVRFLGQHPNRNGPIYAYQGVPKQVFDLFRHGSVPARTDGRNKWGKWWKGKFPSMGASMYTLIKGGNYPYQRLT